MAACAFCFASLTDGDATCPRCGRAVGAAAPVDERPELTPWTAPTQRGPAAPALPDPPAPVAAHAPEAATAPLLVPPPAIETGHRPDAPWRPPDTAGTVPASSAPTWMAPPPVAPQWGALPPGVAPQAPVPVPIVDARSDRANVIVLVVVSVAVIVVIVVLAVLATNAIGPNPDDLEGAAPARPATAQPLPARDPAEVRGGR